MTVYCDLEMDTETALELLGFLQLHRESTPALAPLFCQSASKTFQVTASKSFQLLRCFSPPFCVA